MKKLSRQNLILLAALVLQIALIAVAFWPRQATSANAGKPLIAGLTADQLVGVTVRDMDGNEIHIAKKGDQWVLPAADDFVVTPAKGSEFANKLVALNANRLVTQTETSLKRLKVADDDYLRTLEIELADGTKRLLYVGTSPSWSVTHVRIAGEKEVYLVSGLTISDVDTAASSWIDTKLLAVEADNVTAVTVENANGKLELTRGEDGKWLLKGMAAGEILDDSKVATLVNRVASIYIQRPLGTQPKPEYGLDKPSATVTVQTKDKDGKAGSYTLQVGAKGADGTSYTLLASQSPYYVQVADYAAAEMVTWGLKDMYAAPTPTPEATVQGR